MVVFKQDVCPAEMPCWGWCVRALANTKADCVFIALGAARPLSFIFWWVQMCAIPPWDVFFFAFAKLTFIRVTAAISFPPFPILMWQSARLISECLLCEHADSRRDENAAGKQTAWGDDVFLSFTSVLFKCVFAFVDTLCWWLRMAAVAVWIFFTKSPNVFFVATEWPRFGGWSYSLEM